MIRIRHEQMEAFEAAAERDFRRRLQAYVTRQFASRCSRLNDAGIAAVIDDGSKRARTHGLSTEREIAAFMNFVFILGSGFDAEPWAREILATGGTSSERLEQLKRGALRRLRERSG